MDDKTSIVDLYTPPQTTTAVTNQIAVLSYWGTQGRIGRLRYIVRLASALIVFYMMHVVLTIFSLKFLSKTYFGETELNTIIFVVLFFTIIIAWISFTIRCTMQRIQDFNYNKWFAFLVFIPFVNAFLMLACILIPGTTGNNKYGPPPPSNSIGVFILILILLAMFIVSFTPYSFLPYLMYYL